MKTFLNNKKIHCIPPIYHNNNYITDFKTQAEIFNNFFAKQCTIVNNTSKFPTDSLKRTNNCLCTISFNKDDIAKIIKNVDPNNFHCHDMISIRMLKIYDESILKPLDLILNHASRVENFPSNGKKLMLPQFIKKDKQLKENYRPISLLPFCGKISERLIHNTKYLSFSQITN